MENQAYISLWLQVRADSDSIVQRQEELKAILEQVLSPDTQNARTMPLLPHWKWIGVKSWPAETAVISQHVVDNSDPSADPLQDPDAPSEGIFDGYADLMAAFDEAEFAARRVLAAYDTSIGHLSECHSESTTAFHILADSNQSAATREVAATRA